jgi:hypothetical protein
MFRSTKKLTLLAAAVPLASLLLSAGALGQAPAAPAADAKPAAAPGGPPPGDPLGPDLFLAITRGGNADAIKPCSPRAPKSRPPTGWASRR